MAIESVGISNDAGDKNSIFSRWGIVANEYTYAGAQIDLQDLMVAVTKKRAATVEGEVAPLTMRIQARNKRLEELGEALSDLTKHQADFKSDDSGSRDSHGWISNKTGEMLESLGYVPHIYTISEDDEDAPDPEDDPSCRPSDNEERADFYKATWRTNNQYSANKKTIEGMISRIKSEIDALNNQAQLDISRLQQLVDRRDESFTTATTLMSEISETRDNTIRNM